MQSDPFGVAQLGPYLPMEDIRDLWPYSDVPSHCISIYEGPETFLRDFSRVSRAHQIAFSLFWFQAEVLNGGMAQFFSNSTGVLAPEALAACREIGAHELASELDQAMQWFGTPYPRERDARESALEAFADQNPGSDDPFYSRDHFVAGLIQISAPTLEQVAVAHIEKIGS